MLLIPLVIAAQIIFSTLLLIASPATLPHIKHQVGHVLGVKIAQEPAPAEPAPAPSPETPASSPTTTETPSPSPESTPASPSPSTVESPSPPVSSPADTSTQPPGPNTENPANPPADNSLNEIIFSTPSPQASETTAASSQPTSSEQPSPQPEQLQKSAQDNMAVLNTDEIVSSSEGINQQSVDEVKKEDQMLSQITDPAKQTAQLITFSADKVKDIHENIIKDDFSTTNFASQRFNDILGQAVKSLDQLTPKQAQDLKSKLNNFCNQADMVLRTAQLSVPEGMEQDLEINRANCLATQL